MRQDSKGKRAVATGGVGITLHRPFFGPNPRPDFANRGWRVQVIPELNLENELAPFSCTLPSVEDIVLAFWVMNQRPAPLEVSGCGPG